MIFSKWPSTAVFAWTAIVLVGGAAAGEGPAPEPTTLRELIDAAVEEAQVFVSAESKEPAKPLVVLRWANNARGSEDGTTLLYIHAGRPLAVSCLYPWQGRLAHDFLAVSRDQILARRNGRVIWQPRKSGVEFAEVPDAPKPEATAARRLRQMKALAEQFQSTLRGWKRDDSDREELRLLPRPLYRYQPTDASVVDGAVFAFVMGTDPESLLLLEAVPQGEAAKWQFAFARRTSGELEGRHAGKVVWTADRYPDNSDPRGPAFGFGTLIPPQVLPDATRPPEPAVKDKAAE